MHLQLKSNKAVGFGISTAMAAALLAGCAGGAAPRADISAQEAQEAMAKGNHARAIDHAEAAVLAAPHTASYRITLGNAYLDAGRFASAETAFEDAMTLGDNTARTALSLALTKIAQQEYGSAAALLNDWDQEIAKADLGLALALAGQPERGIHILSNAIRGGENTAKVRQNLSFAYAIAGRWREARLMAQQDLPAGEVGSRMEQWAELASADAYQRRIASLLDVPVGVHDAGLPAQLALANNPAVEQLAVEANSAQVQETELSAVTQAPSVELAALEKTYTPVAATAAPVSAFVSASPAASGNTPKLLTQRYNEPEAGQTQSFAQAFSQSGPVERSIAGVSQDSKRFVSQPVVQHTTSRPAIARQATPNDGSHLIQLGSFASEQGARRAWSIYTSRFPELADREMVITQAVVRGKRYWRVSAGGFTQDNGDAMCRAVRSQTRDGCITWASSRPLPGAVGSGRQLARR